jgi:hypothetical protein
MSLFNYFKKNAKKVVEISNSDSLMSIKSNNNTILPYSASSMSVQVCQLSTPQSTFENLNDTESSSNEYDCETNVEEDAVVGASTCTRTSFFTFSDWKKKIENTRLPLDAIFKRKTWLFLLL